MDRFIAKTYKGLIKTAYTAAILSVVGLLFLKLRIPSSVLYKGHKITLILGFSMFCYANPFLYIYNFQLLSKKGIIDPDKRKKQFWIGFAPFIISVIAGTIILIFVGRFW